MLLGNDDTADVTFRMVPDSAAPSAGDSAMSEPESTVRAHRLVLQARSPVFRSMLAAGMMEGETGVVTVSDMQPDVFRALMHFVYSDDLPEELQVRRFLAPDRTCAAPMPPVSVHGARGVVR